MKAKLVGKLFQVLLMVVALQSCVSNHSLKDPNSGNTEVGVERTALLSFPEIWCSLMEYSAPYAYIGFALQVEGRVRYYRTKTTCEDFRRADINFESNRTLRKVVHGEQVTVYGGDKPVRLRREGGELYDLVPSDESTTRSFFLPSVNVPDFERPESLGENPHPADILSECRLLSDSLERNLCLFYQAGLQNDEGICGEITGVKREQCLQWLANIRNGKVDH